MGIVMFTAQPWHASAQTVMPHAAAGPQLDHLAILRPQPEQTLPGAGELLKALLETERRSNRRFSKAVA